MKNMDMLMLGAVLVLGAAGMKAYADETTMEKVSVKANDAKRGMKKVAHATEEALCTKGDIGCAGVKIKNKAIEVKDVTVDKAEEIKNKID